jgi:hypothetical protein
MATPLDLNPSKTECFPALVLASCNGTPGQRQRRRRIVTHDRSVFEIKSMGVSGAHARKQKSLQQVLHAILCRWNLESLLKNLLASTGLFVFILFAADLQNVSQPCRR